MIKYINDQVPVIANSTPTRLFGASISFSLIIMLLSSGSCHEKPGSVCRAQASFDMTNVEFVMLDI